MTKLSDPKTHRLMRLAGVRPIAMPHSIAVAGPGNKRTTDSLTRTGHIDADGKISAVGLSYVQSILTPIRDAEMRAAADATPFELNTDSTGLRPAATEAERMAHYAANIVADQEQRDADILSEAGPAMLEYERWQAAILAHNNCAHVNGPSDEDARQRCDANMVAARALAVAILDDVKLTRRTALIARATMLDVFTPGGDAGVVSLVGKKDDRVYVHVSLGEGDRDPSGWYRFDQVTVGRDILNVLAERKSH